MVKRLRENRKNKKGFTLVELIVVIVIILVLAAVMVPSVTKYVAKSNQANCKADAASILTQLQVDVAEFYTNDANAGKAFSIATGTKIGNATYTNTPISAVSKNKTFYAEVKEDEVVAFGYQNGKYYIKWSPTDGWEGNWETKADDGK